MDSRKVYKTKQRQLILDCLINNKEKHLTADDVIDYLKDKGNPVGKTTIYRYLDKLVAEGYVRRYFVEEGVSSCYQYIEGEKCHEHFHLKCVGCGSLMHLECNYIESLQEHISNNHKFKVDNLKTVFYGRCEGCEDDK